MKPSLKKRETIITAKSFYDQEELRSSIEASGAPKHKKRMSMRFFDGNEK
tara:strand:- start:317 stop:466 length:150 start_codon:yes stop_codon:yes gene_type:complete